MLTEAQVKDILTSYPLESVVSLAKKHNITRYGVYYILRSNEVVLRKDKVSLICFSCGKEFFKVPSYIKKQKHFFCSADCFEAFAQAYTSEYDQKRAHRIVSQWFPVQSGQIVHYKTDKYSAWRGNFLVFKDQQDHVRYHRGVEVEPLWDGEDDRMEKV